MNFTERMCRAPDEEILRIVLSGEDDGFAEEAVTAAKNELDRRNLHPDALAQMESEFSRDQGFDKIKHLIPLGTAGRVAFVLFGPLLVITISVAIVLRARGYKQKSNDAFWCILLSYAILFSVFGLFFVFGDLLGA
ncbi:MAG: hypothetical protein ABJA20_16825 [Novosphingobium sp.]